MIDEFTGNIARFGDFIFTKLITVLAYPILPTERIYFLYILSSIVLALYVYFVKNGADPAQPKSFRAFISFLFPKRIWRNPSAWLDVRYFFFHQVLRLIIYGVFLTGILNLTFQIVTGGPNLIEASLSKGSSDTTGIIISTLYMFVVIAFVDLASYAIHYLQHKVPLLWEFHKVHHSLEVMHPLSNYREHPIDNITYAIGTGAAFGLVMGLTTNLFGYLPDMPQLLGIPVLILVFNTLGYNLRHSHIWLRWPGRWSMLFASPAHHHIHHSCHPDHIDKNFAFIFPYWDVLFSTYHVPKTNKDIHFGISMEHESEFKSCWGLYYIPFRNVFSRAMLKLKPLFKQ